MVLKGNQKDMHDLGGSRKTRHGHVNVAVSLRRQGSRRASLAQPFVRGPSCGMFGDHTRKLLPMGVRLV